jgi:C4-dicarboxylate-specific signal transduction histidine kinase
VGTWLQGLFPSQKTALEPHWKKESEQRIQTLEKLNNDLEASLLERNYRLTEVFEGVPGEVLWVSQEFRYIKVNGSTALEDGLFPLDYEGKLLGFTGRWLHQKMLSVLQSKVQEGLENRSSALAPFKVTICSQDGQCKWKVSVSKYKNGLDHLIVLLPVHADVALQISQDTIDLATFEKPLVNISSARLATLGEMVAGIAHELNNPLAILSGRIQVLRNRLASGLLSNEELLVELDKQSQSVFRVSKIIKGLRSFARPSERETSENVEPSKGVEDALDFCRGRYHKRNIDVRLAVVCSDLVKCVPVQLTQILLNLLNNSLHAVEELPVKWVEIKTLRNGKMVDFFVSDSGLGVPDEIVGRIFEPFFSTRNQQVGTGLGLSISRGLAESNGGTLRYVSGAANTTFVLSLPAGD